MNRLQSIGQGQWVRLVSPSLTFEGIDPPPIDVNDTGVVAEVKMTRTGRQVTVDWDKGTTAQHDEDELEPVIPLR